MHRRALLASAASAALAACAAPAAPDAPPEPVRPDPVPPPLTPPLHSFDTALYRAVAALGGNQFVSPYSIASAFALLYPGARGETAREIMIVFGFDPDFARQATQARATAQTLTANTGGSEFAAANAAWVERTMGLRAEYARMVRDEMGGAIETVDFIANQREALRRINAWAARETRERIREIIREPNPDRRLVLTNAVYFKGKWADQFSASATRDGDFFTGAETRVPARLMRQITHARYAEADGVQAAEFDYDGGAFALAVFLPRQRTGLEAFERTLVSGADLDLWLRRLADAQRQRLDVTLPKVEMEAEYELGETLQALGLHLAFTGAADFSGVTEAERLAISQVIHKTFLAIDEEGTEAAAVTAIDMVATAAPMGPPPPPPIEFKADHPFFIVLHHKQSGVRLFMGRVTTV
jgi:serpin B